MIGGAPPRSLLSGGSNNSSTNTSDAMAAALARQREQIESLRRSLSGGNASDGGGAASAAPGLPGLPSQLGQPSQWKQSQRVSFGPPQSLINNLTDGGDSKPPLATPPAGQVTGEKEGRQQHTNAPNGLQVGEGAGTDMTWQSDAHLDQRREMVKVVAELLASRKSNPSERWMSELPYKARKLEEQLYRSAPDLQTYLDKKTVKFRLKKVAAAITFHFKDARRKSLGSESGGGGRGGPGTTVPGNLDRSTSVTSVGSDWSLLNFGQLGGGEASTRSISITSNNSSAATSPIIGGRSQSLTSQGSITTVGANALGDLDINLDIAGPMTAQQQPQHQPLSVPESISISPAAPSGSSNATGLGGNIGGVNKNNGETLSIENLQEQILRNIKMQQQLLMGMKKRASTTLGESGGSGRTTPLDESNSIGSGGMPLQNVQAQAVGTNDFSGGSGRTTPLNESINIGSGGMSSQNVQAKAQAIGTNNSCHNTLASKPPTTRFQPFLSGLGAGVGGGGMGSQKSAIATGKPEQQMQVQNMQNTNELLRKQQQMQLQKLREQQLRRHHQSQQSQQVSQSLHGLAAAGNTGGASGGTEAMQKLLLQQRQQQKITVQGTNHNQEPQQQTQTKQQQQQQLLLQWQRQQQQIFQQQTRQKKEVAAQNQAAQKQQEEVQTTVSAKFRSNSLVSLPGSGVIDMDQSAGQRMSLVSIGGDNDDFAAAAAAAGLGLDDDEDPFTPDSFNW